MKLQFESDGKMHRVIYIDYYEGIPHMVISSTYIDTSEQPYWRLYEWDFFANDGDKTDLRSYQAGSGGTIEEGIRAPQWVDGYTGVYWLADDVILKGVPKNGKRIKHPKLIKGWMSKSRNPFSVSEECDRYEYCDKCGCNSTDTCWEHKYEDESGFLRYKCNNEPAE